MSEEIKCMFEEAPIEKVSYPHSTGDMETVPVPTKREKKEKPVIVAVHPCYSVTSTLTGKTRYYSDVDEISEDLGVSQNQVTRHMLDKKVRSPLLNNFKIIKNIAPYEYTYKGQEYKSSSIRDIGLITEISHSHIFKLINDFKKHQKQKAIYEEGLSDSSEVSQ